MSQNTTRPKLAKPVQIPATLARQIIRRRLANGSWDEGAAYAEYNRGCLRNIHGHYVFWAYAIRRWHEAMKELA